MSENVRTSRGATGSALEHLEQARSSIAGFVARVTRLLDLRDEELFVTPLEALRGSRTPVGHLLRRVNDPEAATKVDDAAGRLVEGLNISGKLVNPRACRAAVTFAREHDLPRGSLPHWLRVAALREAMRDQDEGFDRPQFVRIGQRWITDERGRKRMVAPSDLPLPVQLAWLRQRTHKTLEQTIGSQSRGVRRLTGSRETDARRRSEQARDPSPDPEANLIAAECGVAVPETPRAISRLQRLTRRERQVLALDSRNVPTEDIATQLGLATSTVRVHRRNGLRRLTALS